MMITLTLVVNVCCRSSSETKFGDNVLVNNVVIKMYTVIDVTFNYFFVNTL